ncbi:flagellar FliJ protein [Carnobacterium alterfunditum]|uniref:Flagellar FliJ protein n=1 Tax=Carnobacterium alterfunditum TaxID=28230 RepID=A0A1N6I4B8_9LACT|nr:flagellar export protein FliJ [Carnobacterium alterfunditum]SIO26884.1 flagellar FliJ protein [Carnobacterium alterfunditum]
MANYTFSMEKVLDWRSDTEEEKKKNLAQVQQNKLQQETILQRLIGENIKIKNDSLTTSRIDVLRRQNLYKDMIDEKIIHQKNVVNKAEKNVEVARIALMEAHKDRKVMEKLREKEYTFTMEQEKQDEQKQLDEMAALSFGKSFY